MRLAMQGHDAVEFDLRLAFCWNGAFNVLWHEDYVGILLSFEYLLLHLAVAGFAATVSGSGIDHELAARSSILVVKVQRAALQLKSTVHSVQNVTQSEFDIALRWIGDEGSLLGKSDRAQRAYEDNQQTYP